MTNKNHIEGLKALRADLVERRRDAVGKRENADAKTVATSVEHWQRLIEAIDRALADEEESAPAPRSRANAAKATT